MRLLIVGPLEGQLTEATKLAMDGGAKVAHAPSVEIALAALRAGRGADLLLVDVMMDIAGLIAGLEAERIVIPVVACGTESNAAAAVNAIRAGAKEYIPLPPDAELISAVIAAVARESTDFLYRDPAMARVVKLADQVSGSDASVLITGESGTGKEVMAKYLHSRSKRAARPFISINCAAIPEALLESELFGHEKGAFTGAVNLRKGRFEMANKGTIFLDEVGEMTLATQKKLLRVLQEREFERVGGSIPIKVDVRVISATNKVLPQEIEAGRFREDLYYRLNVIDLHLPALRERRDDIPLLVEHFLDIHRYTSTASPARINQVAMAMLMDADWPGNVRQLENVIERAVVLSQGGVITEENIDFSDLESRRLIDVAQRVRSGTSLAELLEDVERRALTEALDQADGDRTAAAALLRIPVAELQERRGSLGL